MTNIFVIAIMTKSTQTVYSIYKSLEDKNACHLELPLDKCLFFLSVKHKSKRLLKSYMISLSGSDQVLMLSSTDTADFVVVWSLISSST